MNLKRLQFSLLLGLVTAPSWAQSSSTLYGIVDVGIRTSTNQGTTRMLGGGMSQSRWGLSIKETLNADTDFIANLENRINADSGTVSTPFFQNSWMGFNSKTWGKLTFGRQYNTTFDLLTTTYVSFPYAPYMEAYKPEVAFLAGARNNNMVKYTFERGMVRAGFQYAFDEKSGASTTSTDPRSVGGYLRLGLGAWAMGAGYQELKLPGDTKVKATTLGGSYKSGPWYFNTGYSRNTVDNINAQGAAVINAYWNVEANGGFRPGATNDPANFAQKREMYKVGVGYQVTPQANLGAHYFHAKQSGSANGSFNSKADFFVVAMNYAISKRTNAYIEVDHTRVRGGTGAYIEKVNDSIVRQRTGMTMGLRHTF